MQRFRCCENVSEEDRSLLCEAFWSTADYQRQKEFIIRNVDQGPVVRRSVKPTAETVPKKQASNSYNFLLKGNRVRVCKKFFEATLSISNKTVISALKNKGDGGTFEGEDGWGTLCWTFWSWVRVPLRVVANFFCLHLILNF